MTAVPWDPSTWTIRVGSRFVPIAFDGYFACSEDGTWSFPEEADPLLVCHSGVARTWALPPGRLEDGRRAWLELTTRADADGLMLRWTPPDAFHGALWCMMGVRADGAWSLERVVDPIEEAAADLSNEWRHLVAWPLWSARLVFWLVVPPEGDATEPQLVKCPRRGISA